MLAQCYEKGHGVAKDYLEARRLYTLASAQGDAEANEGLDLLEETIRAECPLLGKRVRVTGTSRAGATTPGSGWPSPPTRQLAGTW